MLLRGMHLQGLLSFEELRGKNPPRPGAWAGESQAASLPEGKVPAVYKTDAIKSRYNSPCLTGLAAGLAFSGKEQKLDVTPKEGRVDRGRGTWDRKRLKALLMQSKGDMDFSRSYPPEKQNRTASFPGNPAVSL
jgi:hypothetical protein